MTRVILKLFNTKQHAFTIYFYYNTYQQELM
jgi:hypothetical protein